MENEGFSEFNNNIFLVDSKIVDKIKNVQIKNIQIRPNWYINLSKFYDDYIQPNVFALIVFIALFIFLIYRYFSKKEKRKQKIKKSLKMMIENTGEETENKIDNEYLDMYINNYIDNEELTFDEKEEKNDLKTLDDILKYYDDMEKSGLTSSQYIEKERSEAIKKLNFNQLTNLVSGNN